MLAIHDLLAALVVHRIGAVERTVRLHVAIVGDHADDDLVAGVEVDALLADRRTRELDRLGLDDDPGLDTTVASAGTIERAV
jgi:hypothetical protein